MIYFLGLLGHLKSKHRKYIEKFEQRKAEVKAIRDGRRSSIRNRKEEEEDILDSVNLEAEIGEAKEDFHVNESVLFSHNYYRREKTTSTVAECLMCDLAQIKTFIRTSSTRGLIGHLRRKHFEYLAGFELKRAEVLKRRTEKKFS